MLTTHTSQTQEQTYQYAFTNNMLEDIAKMPREEWKAKLTLQKFYLNCIRNEEQKQQAEHYKNKTEIDRLIDSYSIINEFVTLNNLPDKYQTVFKGIEREEQILDGKLSRYYVVTSKEHLSEKEFDQQSTQKATTFVLETIGLGLGSCVFGITRMIKPITAIALCISSPFIVYAKAYIEVAINPPALTKDVKQLYARHYQNDVLLKYVDPKTPCGEYNYMI